MAASDYVDFVLVERRETLRDVFPLIDEGVEAVSERSDDVVIGADVFAAALNGDVLLHLVRHDGEVIGFMATHPARSLSGTRNLHVWMLYLCPGVPDVMPDVVAELDYLAREQGCSGVTFTTTRRAWQRRLARHGYSPSTLSFYKPLEVPDE